MRCNEVNYKSDRKRETKNCPGTYRCAGLENNSIQRFLSSNFNGFDVCGAHNGLVGIVHPVLCMFLNSSTNLQNQFYKTKTPQK